MKQFVASCLAVAFLAPLPVLNAETYTWTDDKGTVFYTDDPGGLPKEIRKKLRKLDEADAASSAKPEATEEGTGEPEAEKAPAPPVVTGAGTGGNSGLYGGKTSGQWQRELDERVVAMNAVRNKIDEIAEKFRNSPPDWSIQQPLLAEHKALREELKEMKKQYELFVETARKTGLKVSIPE